MSNKRFFVNKIASGKAEISGEDFSHLISVLRLGRGDKVSVFNFEHGEFEAEIESIDKKSKIVVLNMGRKLKESEVYTAGISAIISLIKKDKMEFVVEKLTEIGVDKILPVASKRSVIKLKDAAKKGARWEKIIYSAVKQCGRIRMPELSPAAESIEKLDVPAGSDKFFVWEKEDKRFLIDEAVKLTGKSRDVYFIIGPEGGFEESEAQALKDKGFIPVSIGSTTLRAETAAVSAATVLAQALRRQA